MGTAGLLIQTHGAHHMAHDTHTHTSTRACRLTNEQGETGKAYLLQGGEGRGIGRGT